MSKTSCCKTMDTYRESGAMFEDLTTAAERLAGEPLGKVRFCPWCGWDCDRIIGITEHRRKLDEDREIDRIGASRS